MLRPQAYQFELMPYFQQQLYLPELWSSIERQAQDVSQVRVRTVWLY